MRIRDIRGNQYLTIRDTAVDTVFITVLFDRSWPKSWTGNKFVPSSFLVFLMMTRRKMISEFLVCYSNVHKVLRKLVNCDRKWKCLCHFFYIAGLVHWEFDPTSSTVNAASYVEGLKCLRSTVHCKRPRKKNGGWTLHHNNHQVTFANHIIFAWKINSCVSSPTLFQCLST